MGGDLLGVPTPNQWLDAKLREVDLSNAALARLIACDRSVVQRWVNRREQIPRHHLAEIAAHLGSADDLDYAIKLKECEDFADALGRRLREIAKVGKCDPTIIESRLFELLRRKTREEGLASEDQYASALLYNMTHAGFVMRLWSHAASSRDFSKLLSPDNMKLHIRYPANHFLTLALDFGDTSPTMANFRGSALKYLREVAVTKQPHCELSGHHAIHMLARSGDSSDETLVESLLSHASSSDDLLATRLGYAGLIMKHQDEQLADRYVWMLQRQEELARVDTLFEALHYGDVDLGPSRDMPQRAPSFEKSISNVARRLEGAGAVGALRDLEVFRLTRLLSQLTPGFFDSRQGTRSRLIALQDSLTDAKTDKYTSELKQQLSKLAE